MEREAAEKATNEALRYELYIAQLARQQAKNDSRDGKVSEIDSYWVNWVLMTPNELMMNRM